MYSLSTEVSLLIHDSTTLYDTSTSITRYIRVIEYREK